MVAQLNQPKSLELVFKQHVRLYPYEKELGVYQVTVIRRAASGWVPSPPPLDAMVTNFRLILHPQTRRRYPVASIPSLLVTTIAEVELGRHQCVTLTLKTGHQLYLSANWGVGADLGGALRAMLTSPVGEPFKIRLGSDEIRRMIQLIDRL